MLLIDPRLGQKNGETASDRLDKLRASLEKADVPTEVVQLPAGDFALTGHGPDGAASVGVEWKTIPDFVTSMQSGRLAEQVEKMYDLYSWRWVLIEGAYRSNWRTGQLEIPRGAGWVPASYGGPVTGEAVDSFILSLEAQGGIHIVHTDSPAQTVHWLALLHDWWAKPWEAHSSLRTSPKPVLAFTARRESKASRRFRAVAMALGDGLIGHERSHAVKRVFPTLKAMLEATVRADTKAWQQVEGVGKGIAQSITGGLETPHDG